MRGVARIRSDIIHGRKTKIQGFRTGVVNSVNGHSNYGNETQSQMKSSIYILSHIRYPRRGLTLKNFQKRWTRSP